MGTDNSRATWIANDARRPFDDDLAQAEPKVPLKSQLETVGLELIKIPLNISVNAIDHCPVRTRHIRTSIPAARKLDPRQHVVLEPISTSRATEGNGRVERDQGYRQVEQGSVSRSSHRSGSQAINNIANRNSPGVAASTFLCQSRHKLRCQLS